MSTPKKSDKAIRLELQPAHGAFLGTFVRSYDQADTSSGRKRIVNDATKQLLKEYAIREKLHVQSVKQVSLTFSEFYST